MDAGALESLFETVRESCSAPLWSRGVELARAEAVSLDGGEAAGEIALRVATRGGLVSPLVRLHPERDDWECECKRREDVCEHVAAAVIALRRAGGGEAALPETALGRGRIAYRLSRVGATLHLERAVREGERDVPLRTTLSAIGSGRRAGPRFAASGADVAVESVVGARHGALPRGLWPPLLRALGGCPDVTLDGAPVRATDDRVGWRVRVEDDGPGFRLRAARDPRVREVFDDGVALLSDGTLCLLGQANLTGRELEQLGRGRRFGPGDVAELVTEVIPSLSERVPVDIATARLPTTVSAAPRLLLESERRGERLSLLPLLVYGDPPLARVDAGRLVPLGGPVPLRDPEAEARLEAILRRDLGLRPGYRVELRGEEALRFAARLGAFPGEVRGSGHEAFFRAPALEPRFALRGDDGFELHFESPSEPDAPARRADARQVLRAWRAGESLVPLVGGGLAALPSDWLARFGDPIADLLAARSASGRVPPCVLPDLARLCEAQGEPPPPAFAALRAALLGETPAAALPADLRAELRPYQREGVAWLCRLRDAGLGALLADDMGLGKTLQALCALRGRALVVAPTSVLHNWEQETRRFRPGLRICVYHGPGRRLDPEAELTLTTWALLRLDVDTLAAESWDAVVLDEAQAIKNASSATARAAFRLEAPFRLALTGTPVENRLEELWSELRFALPGLLGDRRDFQERYARPIEAGEAAATERLRERIRPFALRRQKQQVAPELPPRTDVVLHPELSEAERAVYEAVRLAARRDITEKLDAGANPLAVLEALLRLRQAACHSALVPGQRAQSSSKLELLLEVLDEAVADGHKALVFSQWTSLLDLVEPALERQGIAFTRLDGSTRDRAGVVGRFQGPDGPPVLLASLKAGGVGLNLTAADCVFILDPWWNPAAEDQAADRAHRIGQTKPVLVYRLVSQGTVEEGVLALQERKRQLAEAAIGDAGRAAGLSREELLSLLE